MAATGASRRAARTARDRRPADAPAAPAAPDSDATAPVTPEPDAAPAPADAPASEPEVTPDAQPDAQPEPEITPEAAPEPEITPEPDQPQDEPQPREDAPAPEPAQDAPASDAAPQDPATFAGLLAAGVAEQDHARKRALLLRAGALLAVRTEHAGGVGFRRMRLNSASGRSPAALDSFAQVLSVLGMHGEGRAITHDNVNASEARQALMLITGYEDVLDDAVALLTALDMLITFAGNTAKAASRTRRAELKRDKGTYDDNLAERAAMRRTACELALGIAFEIAAELDGKPDELITALAQERAVVLSTIGPPVRGIRRPVILWNTPEVLQGLQIPQILRPAVTPAPAPQPAAQEQQTATAAA